MHPQFALGLDLGGTQLKAGLVDRAGTVGRFLSIPSRAAEGAGGPIEAIAEATSALLRDHDVAAIALGTPGMVDALAGVVTDRTPHLPHWTDFALGAALRARLGREVAIENDANLAALAEHRAGAARGARVSITVTVGTGIGSGIVIEGRVMRGFGGGAGEIGHLPLGSGEFACRCGVANCVEPEASGSGLVRQARALDLDVNDASGVFAAAAAGEPNARALIARLADRLGAVIGVAVNTLNPDVVVVGGGVADAGEALFAPLRAALERYTLASHRRGLRLLPAMLGNRAGVVGAGLLAWENVAQS